MIEVANLTKSFFLTRVLAGVTLRLGDGGIHGLLGRNGVGKSTLLGILAGQIKHDGGEVEVMGQIPFDNAAVMDRVALTGVDTPYPSSWTGRTILEAAALRYPRWDQAAAQALITDFDLGGVLATRFSAMSRGQKAMVGIVVGLASGAPLTMLDEPYVGLDTHNRDVFYRHLLRAGESERTFLVATHHIHESAKVLDSFLILGRDGRLQRHESVADVADAYVVATAPELPDLPGVLGMRRSAELDRALLPRDALTRPIRGLRTSNAAIDDVIDALLEVS